MRIKLFYECGYTDGEEFLNTDGLTAFDIKKRLSELYLAAEKGSVGGVELYRYVEGYIDAMMKGLGYE